MGKFSQRHLASTLPGRSLRRRSPFAVITALAAVAVTTTAGGASLVTHHDTKTVSAAVAKTTDEVVASTAGAVASTPEEQAALDAASTELVRAEYLAGEGASALAPEDLTQITATRDQLRELLSATTTATATVASAGTDEGTTITADAATDTTLDASGVDTTLDTTLDGRDTFRASRAGAEGREPLPAEDTATEPAAEEAATTPQADATTEQKTAPTIEEIGATTEALRTLLDSTGVTVSVEPAGPTPEEIAAQQAAEQAALAAQLAAWANSTAGYANGTIPETLLCSPSFAPGHFLRCDAAHQLEQLNVAYRAAFGTDISVTSSYRSYATQVAVKAQKGYLAAPPGTSNHGMAQALDLGGGISSFGSAQYAWMRANAPAYGWDNPTWARQGGSKPEAWHWEYGTTY